MICDCAIGARLRQERSERLRSLSDLPARFAGYSFESYLALVALSDDQRQAAQLCQEYTTQGQLESKLGLFLWGNPGTGKSGLAASVCQAAWQRGVAVLYRAVPDLLDYFRAAFNPDHDSSYDETFNRVKSVDLLILDDLGTEQVTPWVREKLLQLIDYRYRNNLRLIITSNLSVAELAQRYSKQDDMTGLRIADRIMEMCVLINVNGNNLR
jgi:DNA replication protein DnaC